MSALSAVARPSLQVSKRRKVDQRSGPTADVDAQGQRFFFSRDLVEHMSALKRDPRELLLGPTGRCQSAEVDQRSLSKIAALLLMLKRRVIGSLSRVH